MNSSESIVFIHPGATYFVRACGVCGSTDTRMSGLKLSPGKPIICKSLTCASCGKTQTLFVRRNGEPDVEVEL